MTTNEKPVNRYTEIRKGNYNESIQGDYYQIIHNHPQAPELFTITKPLQAPPLPNNFVERPEHHIALKKLLLQQEVNNQGTLVVSAIHGLGGIGKSTLAAAVAHDKDVQDFFTDGILWATLGKEPDLLLLLTSWIQALGENQYKPLKEDDAKRHLQTLLYNKRVLLIVDDAWKPEHVEYFQVGRAGCRVLVTTREAVISGVEPYNLDVMTESEALELLENQLKFEEFTQEEQEQAKLLAETVGYLPLALELVAAQVADGITWEDLLKDLSEEIARLDTLDRFVDISNEEKRKKYSLVASFNLSLRSLSPELLQQFTWFGVLPEDVVITHAMAATLWGVNNRQALTILRQLRSKALLQTGAINFDKKPTYKLHDLMHDVAVGLLTGEKVPNQSEKIPGLGLSISDAHSELLNRYKETSQLGQWSTLPDDGYIHAHLTWHFERAKQLNQVHQLLQEETPAGRNSWYEACDKLGQVANFVRDVELAWKLAEETFQENPAESIALQCRYALITASLNSLTKNIPAELIAALVKQKLWSPAQGLAYAKQAKESNQQAENLSKLAPHLPQEMRQIEALEAARGIKDNKSRAKALTGLAPYLPEVVPEALATVISIQAAAISIKNDNYYAKRLKDFTRRDSDDRENDKFCGETLSELVPHLSQELLPKALETACSIQNGYYRAYALSKLAPCLSLELLHEALEAARSIYSDTDRAYALRELAIILPQVLPEALEAASSIKFMGSEYRAYALGKLAPYLPQELLLEALEAARSIQDDYCAYTLCVIAIYLPQVLPEALTVVRGIQDDRIRVQALSELALHLPQVLPEALEAACSIQNDQYRKDALRKLAPHIPQELLPQALAAACDIQDGFLRALVLGDLAPHLPQKLLLEALEAARGIRHEEYSTYDYYRAYALRELAQYLPQILPEALKAACAINDEYDNYHRAEALKELAPLLTEELLLEALEVTRGIRDDSSRARSLSRLAPHLPQELLPEALAATYSMKYDSGRAYALRELAPHLPQELLSEALAAARDIQEDHYRAYALAGLALLLPQEVLSEALALSRSIERYYKRTQVLRELALHFPQLLPEALESVFEIEEYQDNLWQLFDRLAPHLPQEVLPQAIKAVYSFGDDECLAKALGELAPHLPQKLLLQALQEARSIEYGLRRVLALSELAPRLPEVLPEALDIARSIESDKDRAHALRKLVPHLPQVLEEALDAARSIESDKDRADALGKLALHLPQILEEALDTACKIQDDSHVEIFFSHLLWFLKLTSIEFQLWCKILHKLSQSYRSELLENIPNLSNVIIALGGTEALTATIRAIHSVCKQWR